MKIYLFATLFFAVYGCNDILPNPSGCPNLPGILESGNVKKIIISAETVTQESGMLQADNDLGYVFEGQAGQKLNYQTKDDICLWIFNVDTERLNDTTLPKSGTYTIQIAVAKGSTTFNLDLSFGELQSSSPSSEPSSQIEQPSSQTTITSSFTQDQAIDIIGRWLDAKAQVFGRDYNSQILSEFLTGERYSKALESVSTLQQQNAYYEYPSNGVEALGDISINSDRATLNAVITEDVKFYVNGNLNNRYTTFGPKRTSYRIEFKLDNGIWKIEKIDKI